MKMQILEAIFSVGQKENWQSTFWKLVQYQKPKTSYYQCGGEKTKPNQDKAKQNRTGAKMEEKIKGAKIRVQKLC